MHKLILAAALTAILVPDPGHAAPSTDIPASLFATGDVNAVFAFVDAGDRSQLRKVGDDSLIFDNQSDAGGATRSLGFNSGLIQFQLFNTTQNYSFLNDGADAPPGGDGFAHARYGATEADFGVTFSDAANSALAVLANSGPIVLIGYEDRRQGNDSDFDYNDLIFAFSAVSTTVNVPEPASILLLGLGVMGLAALRRSPKLKHLRSLPPAWPAIPDMRG